MLHKTFTLLTIDLSMFGEGAPAGEGGAPAAAEAPAAAPEVRYGKQPEQTAAPQQTQTSTPETPPDKGKLFAELIKGEYKDQYTEATQKLINRRFRDTDARIQAMQPIVDLISKRYGVEDGDLSKVAQMLESDNAFWNFVGEMEGKSGEEKLSEIKKDIVIDRLTRQNQTQQKQWLAQQQYAQWEQEAAKMRETYSDFDLDVALENDVFALMLKNRYSMEQAYKAAFAEQIAAKAAAGAEKAVVDNIKARGTRPSEAGANPTPAFTVKDDVSKLSDKDVLSILSQISNGGRVTFG